MVRGQLAHEVLEHTFRRAAEETGEPRVTRANLGGAERILLEELDAAALSSASRPSRRACAPRRAGSSSTCSATSP